MTVTPFGTSMCWTTPPSTVTRTILGMVVLLGLAIDDERRPSVRPPSKRLDAYWFGYTGPKPDIMGWDSLIWEAGEIRPYPFPYDRFDRLAVLLPASCMIGG